MTYPPERVIPRALRDIVDPLPYWFVIGGHAVRCLCPYRPSRDVDFAVEHVRDLDDLVQTLERTGATEILERSDDTVHMIWNRLNISIFQLERLAAFTENRRLTVEGILATKLHAILDRGTRRDFFDLYVTMQHEQIGITGCLAAMRNVYQQPIRESLLLRALTYFDDAEREARLPGEGPRDWTVVTAFFLERVGNLLVPPRKALAIQARKVDLADE